MYAVKDDKPKYENGELKNLKLKFGYTKKLLHNRLFFIKTGVLPPSYVESPLRNAIKVRQVEDVETNGLFVVDWTRKKRESRESNMGDLFQKYSECKRISFFRERMGDDYKDKLFGKVKERSGILKKDVKDVELEKSEKKPEKEVDAGTVLFDEYVGKVKKIRKAVQHSKKKVVIKGFTTDWLKEDIVIEHVICLKGEKELIGVV